MRFPAAAIYFIVAAFIFFVFFVVISLLLGTVSDAIGPFADDLSSSDASDLISLISTGFGVIAAIFFVTGILLIFFLDATADEPEYYWRRY